MQTDAHIVYSCLRWHHVTRCLAAQDVFNLLPNLGIEELARSFAVQSNDMMLAIYLASLTRSVLALHNLIDNKVITTLQPPFVDSSYSRR